MVDALSGKIALSCDSNSDDLQVKDSKVLSWDGRWIDFSDLKVGDKIMNPDGQYQEILQVHEQGMKQFYRVSFEDGTSTECCGNHLWSFWESQCNSRRKSSNGINPVESNLTPRGWNTNYITRARVRDTHLYYCYSCCCCYCCYCYCCCCCYQYHLNYLVNEIMLDL